MGHKILVADDEPTARAVTLKILEVAGYSTLTATDGIQAVETAESGAADLIVLDLLLPRRDGYAALLDLRSRASTRDTPVIILSGEESDAHSAVARTLGAQGYISKPIRREAFLALIEQALRKGGAR
jgi:CheY-like chemotaxis protein